MCSQLPASAKFLTTQLTVIGEAIVEVEPVFNQGSSFVHSPSLCKRHDIVHCLFDPTNAVSFCSSLLALPLLIALDVVLWDFSVLDSFGEVFFRTEQEVCS